VIKKHNVNIPDIIIRCEKQALDRNGEYKKNAIDNYREGKAIED
jgi:hypothetical protein